MSYCSPLSSSSLPCTPLTFSKYQQFAQKLSISNHQAAYAIFSFLSLQDQINSKKSCKNWNKLTYQVRLNDLQVICAKTNIVAHCCFKVIVCSKYDWQNLKVMSLNYDLKGPRFTLCIGSNLFSKELFNLISHRLIALDLTQYMSTEPSLVESFAKICMQLRFLALPSQSLINDQCLEVIAENCNHLTYLNLEGQLDLTDASLIAIASHCPHIETLNCLGCEKMSDSTLLQLQQHYPNSTIIF